MTQVATSPLPTDGQPSTDLNRLGSTSPGEKPAAWPTWRLHAFRFAFAVSVIAGLRMLPLSSNYLVGGMAEMIQPVFAATTQVEYQAVMRTGALLIDTALGREPRPWLEMVIRNNANAASGAVCYAIGTVVIASAITLLWGVLDRKRGAYTTLYACHRLYLRYVVALTVMVYAMVKVVPTQFGVLTAGAAIRPYGDFSRFDVLWNFMVVSTGYTVFTGLLELSGAVLLMFRRTTTLGTLVVCAALVNIFAMDVAFNIRGAVIIAMLLLILSSIILAPSLPGLFAILVQGQRAELPSEPVISLAAWRYAPAVTIAFIGVLLLVRATDQLQLRRSFFTTHVFSGLFEVRDFTGAQAPVAGAAGATSWVRVAGDDRYGGERLMVVQYADGSVRRYQSSTDPAARMLTLKHETGSAATLRYEVQTDGSITLTGEIDARPATMRLLPVDKAKLPSLLRGR